MTFPFCDTTSLFWNTIEIEKNFEESLQVNQLIFWHHCLEGENGERGIGKCNFPTNKHMCTYACVRVGKLIKTQCAFSKFRKGN